MSRVSLQSEFPPYWFGISWFLKTGILASPQSAPGNLDNSKSGEIKGNGGGGSRENSTVDFSKVILSFPVNFLNHWDFYNHRENH